MISEATDTTLDDSEMTRPIDESEEPSQTNTGEYSKQDFDSTQQVRIFG